MTEPNQKKETHSVHSSIIRKWIQGGLIFFFLASLLGVVMRFFWIEEIPFLDYKHILHAHSHSALLGWGYILITGILLYLFVSVNTSHSFIKKLLLVLAVVTAGIFISFLYQGYGVVSSTTVTLHIFISYVFAWFFLKNWKIDKDKEYYSYFRWALIWQLVSTLGLWAVPIVGSTLGKAHELYHMSVQFFLHFQFNGWFSYALLGLIIYYLNGRGYFLNLPKYTFSILQISLLLTYAQSITWSNPLQTIFYFNSLGVLLQAVAFFIIFRNVWNTNISFSNHSRWMKSLLFLGIGSLIFKVFIQTMVVVPQIATISYTIRNFVIGFIHLIMLGAVTMMCGFMCMEFKLINNNKITRLGWIVLIIGFVLTELILFGQGTLLWMRAGYVDNYYKLIFGATVFLPVAIGLLVYGNWKNMKPIKSKYY